jgi:hypothetical protein
VGVRGREEELELFLVFLAIIGGFFFLLPPGTRLPKRRKEGRERERERERERKEKKDLERQMAVASEKRRAVIFAAGALLFVL